jgi:magnesium transporter
MNENEFGRLYKLLAKNLLKELKDELSDMAYPDIAEFIMDMDDDKLAVKIFRILPKDISADVFAYLENVEDYLAELDNEKAADIIESMDADDAVDILDELDEEKKQEIIELIEDDEVLEDIKLIDSYDDNLIGSKMTTNFVTIDKSLSVKKATSSVIKQASDNDNISTIYVVDGNKFYGAIELRDLVVARETTPLENIISTNFKTQDWNGIKSNIRKVLQTFFLKKVKRKPMILPIIIETK